MCEKSINDFVIVWLISQYLGDDEKTRTELHNTAHNGMLVVTLIGIL